MKKRNESATRTRDAILIVTASFLLALIVGALILLLQGEDPIEVYRYLLIDPLISKNGLLKVLGKATPLIFTGLAGNTRVSLQCVLTSALRGSSTPAR